MTGTPNEPFNTGLGAIAVDSSSGDLYASAPIPGDTIGGVIYVFGPATVLAEVGTGTASGVEKTTAKLEGTVNPDETSVSSCKFEYRTAAEETYAHSVACAQTLPLTGNTPIEVSAELTGLQAGTIYYERLSARNSNATNYGSIQSFTTPAAVDGVNTGVAEAVSATGATLTGALSPDGTDAHYYFQYGTDTSYGSTSPALPGSNAGTASESVHAETALSGLLANTVYHYRLVAENALGTTYGDDATFSTAGAPRVAGESAEVLPTTHAGQTSATLQAQVYADQRETTDTFEYGETASYGTSVPVPPSAIGSEEGPVPVPATELTGLKVGTTYHYRVVASNEYGTTDGPDQRFTTLGPLLLSNESASGVAATSASLSVSIDSLGNDTHVYFQYGTVSCAANPASCSEVPLAPGFDIGSGDGDVSPSVHLAGLAPATTYHFRVVASNATGTVTGGDETFTTQGAATIVALPDSRQWEMVTPPEKYGSEIIAVGNEQGDDIQAASEGNGITFGATAPFAKSPAGSNSPEVTQVISVRTTPGSWESHDITTPHSTGPSRFAVGHSAEYKLFSSDLSVGFVEPDDNTPLPPLPASAEKTIYGRLADGDYEALASTANIAANAGLGGLQFVSATPDGSHVILDSPSDLAGTPLPPGATQGLYKWADGRLELASVLPDGEPSGGVLGDNNELVRHAISNNGTRLIWSGERLEHGQAAPWHLYMRDMAKGETVQVDAAQGAPEPKQPAYRYRTASSDGSRVFFTSPLRLTADATVADVLQHQEEDLYVFEVTSASGAPLAGKLTDLTVDGNVGETAGMEGVIGASEEGAEVYFVAHGVLGDGGEHGAQARGNNLYLERYSETTKAWVPPVFIAALSSEDEPSWGMETGDLRKMTSQVSPNGQFLAFMSDASLTGYENSDANSNTPDEEVFLYNADTGHLACASCDPTGSRPVGIFEGNEFEERLVDYGANWRGRWIAGNIPGWTSTNLSSALYQSRYLDDSGRLFFDSADALVPADVNGEEDVYEYEPVGVGSCQPPDYGQSASAVYSAGVGGCIGLISAGTSSEESAFMDASESGGDVFFLTLSHLSPRDFDTSADIYDAHECTASAPCAPPAPVAPPPCTTGDACKAAPTPQPAIFGAPSARRSRVQATSSRCRRRRHRTSRCRGHSSS